MEHQNKSQCTDAKGLLPACAPLASPYVPYQQDCAGTYEAKKGLVRGTLFPGLDLPFLGMVNENEKSDTPMHELQALSFAINDLGLYLDTHRDDTEALELYRQYVQLYHQGEMQYEKLCGPLTMKQAGISGKYDWLQSPWPWQYEANQEA